MNTPTPAEVGAIKWEEPPGNPRLSAANSEVANQLRMNPGRWALIREDADPALVTRINKGQGSWAPAGHFQSRGVGISGSHRRYRVYARYIGEGESSS